MKISTEAEASVVPVTRGSRQKNFDEVCDLAFCEIFGRLKCVWQ